MNTVHVHHRADLEDGVELHRHAQTTKHHVCVTVLCPKRLVGDFETRRAVDGAVDPGYLQTNDDNLRVHRLGQFNRF